MANVTGNSAQVVSDQMTAVWNNFDDGSKSLEYYADVMTALGAATASSTDEIVTGLEKFAAVAETVGLSYEYATAALATVTAETRQSAEVVGTAFKTLFARLQDLELGETLDDGTTIGTYSQALATIGINIKTASGELKDMDDILNELGSKWNTLTQDVQVAVAEQVAGVRQYTQLLALMNNWDVFQSNLNVAYGSEGTLQEQQDIYEESWQASADRLRGTIEGIYEELVPDELFIEMTDSLNEVAETVKLVVSSFGGLEGIIGMVAMALMTKFQPNLARTFDSGLEKIANLKNGLEGVKTLFSGMGSTVSGAGSALFGGQGTDKRQAKVGQDIQQGSTSIARQYAASLDASLAFGSDDKKGIVPSEGFKTQIESLQKIHSINNAILLNRKNLTATEQENLSIMLQEAQTLSEQLSTAVTAKATAREEVDAVQDEAIFDSLADSKYVQSTTSGTYAARGKIVTQEDVDLINNMAVGYGTITERAQTALVIEKTNSQMKKVTLGTQDTLVERQTSFLSTVERQAELEAKLLQIGKGKTTLTEEEVGQRKALIAAAEKDGIISKETAESLSDRANKTRQLSNEFNKLFAREAKAGSILNLDPEVFTRLRAAILNYVKADRDATEAQGSFNQKITETKVLLGSALKSTVGAANTVMTATRTVSSFAMSLNMVANAVQTLKSSDASFFQKFSAGAMAAVSIFSILGTALGGLNKIYEAYITKQMMATDVGLAGIFVEGLKQKEKKETLTAETAELAVQELANVAQSQGIGLDTLQTAVQNQLNDAKVKGTITETTAALILAALDAQKAKDVVVTGGQVVAEETHNKTKERGIILNKLLGTSGAAYLAIIIAVIAAIAALVAIAVHFYKVWKSKTPEERLKQAKESGTKLKEELDEAKTAAENLKSAFDEYTDITDTLDKCTKGTKAWREALEETNQAVVDLVNEYPELLEMGAVSNVGGVLSIDEDALEQVLNDYNDKVVQQQIAVNLADDQVRNYEEQVKAKELFGNRYSAEDLSYMVANSEALLAGTASSEVLNRLDLTGQASEALREDIQEYVNLVNKNNLAAQSANTVAAGLVLQDSDILTTDYGNQVSEALTTASDNITQSSVDSFKGQLVALEKGAFNTYTATQSGYVVNTAGTIAKQKELEAAYKELSEFKDDENFKFLGFDSYGNMKYQYYDEESKEIKEDTLTQDALAAVLASGESFDNLNTAAQQLYETFKILESETLDLGTGFSSFLTTGDLSDTTKAELDAFNQVLSNKGENETDQDALLGALKAELGLSAKEKIPQHILDSRGVGSEEELAAQLLEEMKLMNAGWVKVSTVLEQQGVDTTMMDLEAATVLANAYNNLGAINQAEFTDLYEDMLDDISLTPAEKKQINDVLGEIDWTEYDAMDTFISQLDSLGIELGLGANQTQEFAELMRLAAGALPIDEFLAFKDVAKSLISELSDIKYGDIIDEDVYKELLARDSTLAQYFIETADGFQLISQAGEQAIRTAILASNKLLEKNQALYEDLLGVDSGTSLSGDAIEFFGNIAQSALEADITRMNETQLTAYKQVEANLSDVTDEELYAAGYSSRDHYLADQRQAILNHTGETAYVGDLFSEKNIAVTTAIDSKYEVANDGTVKLAKGASSEAISDYIQQLQDALDPYEDFLEDPEQAGLMNIDSEAYIQNLRILGDPNSTAEEIATAGNYLVTVLDKVESFIAAGDSGTYEQDDITYRTAIEAKSTTALDKLGIKDENLEAYQAGLQAIATQYESCQDAATDYNETIIKVKDGTLEGEEATEALAKAERNLIKAIKDAEWNELTKQVKDYYETLQDSTDYLEIENAYAGIATAINDTFDTSVTAEWVKSQKGLIKEWANATGIEAVNVALKIEALAAAASATPIVITTVLGTESVLSAEETYSLLKDAIENNPITYLAEGKADLTGLVNALIEAGATAEWVANYLASIGQTEIVLEGAGGELFSGDIEDTESFIEFWNSLIETKATVRATGGYTPALGTADMNKVGGSKSDSSSSPKKADKVKKSDTVERYKEIEDKLDDIADASDAANTAMDRLYGANRLKKMEEVNALLREEIKLTKEKREEALAYLAEDKTALEQAARDAGVSLTYDSMGNISNYTEQMTKLWNQLDSAITKANADGNATDAEQDKIDAIQEKIDSLTEAIEQYDETRELITDLDTEIQEAFNEWQDNNYEMLNYQLEIKITLNDADMELLEYYLGVMEDDYYQMAEAAALISGNDGKIDTTREKIAAYSDQINELHTAYDNGDISQTDFVEGLQELQSEMYSTLTELRELDEEMLNYYGNTLQAASEELEYYTGLMENHNDVLEHYMDIMDGLGKSTDYKAIATILEAQEKVAENAAAVSKANYEALAAQEAERRATLDQAIANGASEAEIEMYEQQWKDAQEAASEAQDQMLSDVETWIDKINAVLENKLADMAQALEKGLTGGFGSFDELNTSLERSKSLQEEYLTTTNKIYETNKLMRTVQKAIDETTNTVAKNRLKQFINETEQLQNQTKLSEYELKIQQAKYDLLLAEIALEEAQNAKSTVRLRRDSEGNYGYVYTADQNAIADAEQKLEDAQNSLYNIGLEGANDYMEKYWSILAEGQEALTELTEAWRNGEIASEEEFYQKASALVEYYNEKLMQYSSLRSIALTTDNRVVADAWSTDFADMITSSNNWKDKVSEYVSEVSDAFSDWNGKMETIATDTLGDLTAKTEDIVDASNEFTDAITNEDNGVIKGLTDEINAVLEVVDAYTEYRNAILEVIEAMQDLMDVENEHLKGETTQVNSKLDESEGEKTSLDFSSTESETSTSYPYGKASDTTGNLKKGAKGDFVKAIQYALNELGYGNSGTQSVDGIFGSKTAAAVKAFQAANGLSSDGIVGTLTRNAFKLQGFDSGGYTGAWGSYGKLAMLHEKELVLNAQDTENFLAGMNILDRIVQAIDLQTASAQIGGILSTPGLNGFNNGVLEQTVSIEAHFPNVENSSQIEEAFENLVNKAAQYANRK